MTECVSIEANAIEANAIDTNAIEAKNNHIIYILNACGIICNSFSQLDGLLIPLTLKFNLLLLNSIIHEELKLSISFTLLTLIPQNNELKIFEKQIFESFSNIQVLLNVIFLL